MDRLPRISANLSDEARRGWEAFCESQGVTLSGLLEAAGQIMAERGPLSADVVVERARKIDRERTRRP